MKFSLYGSVGIPKRWCKRCESESFFIDGKIKCCGIRLEDEFITKVKRESQADTFKVSDFLKKKVWALQKGICFCCGIDLSRSWWYRKKDSFRRIVQNYDHFIPKVYQATNNEQNIYLMCNLCNAYKSSKIFDSVVELREYVINKRRERGTLEVYSDLEKKAVQIL